MDSRVVKKSQVEIANANKICAINDRIVCEFRKLLCKLVRLPKVAK